MRRLSAMLACAALIGASASSAQAAEPREVPPAVARQVPIIAGKLQNWRGVWGAVDGKLACKTVKSSGDADIDKIGCSSLVACIKPHYGELKAIADSKASAADKKRRIGAKLKALDPCLHEQRGNGIAALAVERGMGK